MSELTRPIIDRIRNPLAAASMAVLALSGCNDTVPAPEATPVTSPIVSPAPEVIDTPSPAAEATTPADTELYQVIRVVDGDTIKVDMDGDGLSTTDAETIRLIGVNTPETVDPGTPVQCFGPEASAYVTQTLAEQYVGLEADPSQGLYDRYGRTLAYVILNGDNFNLQLIEQGFGFEYTYNQPYKYRDEFLQAQAEADRAGIGLWATDTCDGELKPLDEQPTESGDSYRNCTEARAAGAAPLHEGEPGYGRHLDGDGDGIACE